MENNNYLNTVGRIFDIQRFSVHDGPGIRTIVFLKGCVLRCRWCCNPESQSPEIQTMTIGGKTKTVGRDITVAEVLEQVKKDRPYYARSGGGMTLSGGESLMQYRFAADLLRGAKEAGINTALESTACADYKKIRALLENLDTYLLDIKHIDSRKHKEFTGVGNELILANALKLSEDAKKLVIRVPVIPGFNNTEADTYIFCPITGSATTNTSGWAENTLWATLRSTPPSISHDSKGLRSRRGSSAK